MQTIALLVPIFVAPNIYLLQTKETRVEMRGLAIAS